MFFSWSHIYGLEAINPKNTSSTDRSFHFVKVDPRCYYEPEMNGNRNFLQKLHFEGFHLPEQIGPLGAQILQSHTMPLNGLSS